MKCGQPFPYIGRLDIRGWTGHVRLRKNKDNYSGLRYTSVICIMHQSSTSADRTRQIPSQHTLWFCHEHGLARFSGTVQFGSVRLRNRASQCEQGIRQQIFNYHTLVCSPRYHLTEILTFRLDPYKPGLLYIRMNIIITVSYLLSFYVLISAHCQIT